MGIKINRSLLRRTRLRHSWSQEQLADRAGISLRTVQRMESTGETSLHTCRKVAGALGIDEPLLLPGHETPTKLEDSFSLLFRAIFWLADKRFDHGMRKVENLYMPNNTTIPRELVWLSLLYWLGAFDALCMTVYNLGWADRTEGMMHIIDIVLLVLFATKLVRRSRLIRKVILILAYLAFIVFSINVIQMTVVLFTATPFTPYDMSFSILAEGLSDRRSFIFYFYHFSMGLFINYLVIRLLRRPDIMLLFAVGNGNSPPPAENGHLAFN